MQYSTPEFVIENAQQLRRKTNILFYLVFILSAGFLVSAYNWYQTQQENARLDQQISGLKRLWCNTVGMVKPLLNTAIFT